jgi:hypothetical protein
MLVASAFGNKNGIPESLTHAPAPPPVIASFTAIAALDACTVELVKQGMPPELAPETVAGYAVVPPPI